MLIRSRSQNLVNAYVCRALHFAGLKYDYVSIAHGAFDLLIVVNWLLGKKCVRLWTGTDTIKVKWFKDFRIRAKVCSWFCDNIAFSEWLANNVRSVGIKCGVLDFYEHFGLFTKKVHSKEKLSSGAGMDIWS